MPYVTQEERAHVEDHARRLGNSLTGAGQLNFAITKIVLAYLGETPRYADFALVHGVLGDVWDELHRRLVVPYERRKCHDNGDVY